jgi:formate dehydrogenase major subunit
MAPSHRADQPADRRCLTVVEVMEAVHRGEISGMYIMGENRAMSDLEKSPLTPALSPQAGRGS